eukprot:78282_1
MSTVSRLYCNVIHSQQTRLLRCRTSTLYSTYTRNQLSKYSFSAKQTKAAKVTDQNIKINKQTNKKRTKFLLTSFLALNILGISWIAFKPQNTEQNKQKNVLQNKNTQNVNIGQGEWTMIDHDNNKVNNTSFLGKYQIVYFGFTYCPDVCPRELSKIANALRLLEKRGFEIGKDIIPIFVSVDPKRDTPENIKKYVVEYHPKIRGLVGSSQETKKIAKAYKAYYSARNDVNTNEDYYVDHSSITYIMSPNGEWLGHISTIDDDVAMAEKICVMIKENGGDLPSVGLRQKIATLFA